MIDKTYVATMWLDYKKNDVKDHLDEHGYKIVDRDKWDAYWKQYKERVESDVQKWVDRGDYDENADEYDVYDDMTGENGGHEYDDDYEFEHDLENEGAIVDYMTVALKED